MTVSVQVVWMLWIQHLTKKSIASLKALKFYDNVLHFAFQIYVDLQILMELEGYLYIDQTDLYLLPICNQILNENIVLYDHLSLWHKGFYNINKWQESEEFI